MNNENFGKVVKIDNLKGLGIIKSDANKKEYYFLNYSLDEVLNVNDNVVFLIGYYQNNPWATAVRKYYVNKHGIKFYPRIDTSHIHIPLNEYFPLIINHIDNTKTEFRTELYQFEKIIGKTECVKTNGNDDIIYAIRKGRKGHSRFVLNRFPEETDSIKTVLKKSYNGYVIITIFFGNAGPEPYDERASDKDVQFWLSHALLYKKDDIIYGTETKECPWLLDWKSKCNHKIVNQK